CRRGWCPGPSSPPTVSWWACIWTDELPSTCKIPLEGRSRTRAPPENIGACSFWARSGTGPSSGFRPRGRRGDVPHVQLLRRHVPPLPRDAPPGAVADTRALGCALIPLRLPHHLDGAAGIRQLWGVAHALDQFARPWT